MVEGLEVCKEEPKHEIEVVLAGNVILSLLSRNYWDSVAQLQLNILKKSACEECNIRVLEDHHHFGILALSFCEHFIEWFYLTVNEG
jgi:hypothetical protein